MTFGGWVQKHAYIFGLRSEDETAGMLEWEDVFAAARYGMSDLDEATDYLAANPERLTSSEGRYGGKLSMHLAAITARIRDRRTVLYRQETDAHEHDRGTCTTCGGTGRVVVPHLAGVKDGEWVPVQVARGGSSYYTQAVLCHCALGRWVGDRITDAKKRPMRLEEYSARNAGWPGQLAARQREQAARAWLEAKPGEKADWQALQRRLAEQFSM